MDAGELRKGILLLSEVGEDYTGQKNGLSRIIYKIITYLIRTSKGNKL